MEYNILTTLPVKSLVRFRCVCESWRTLISTPQFIKTHLISQSNCQKLLYFRDDPGTNRVRTFDLEESDQERSYFPTTGFYCAYPPRILCSYNGLVLLGSSGRKRYVLWNPSLREHRTFMCPCVVDCDDTCDTLYGIFYDSEIDDYKVVFITDMGDGCRKYCYMVYAYQSNSWTEIRDFTYSVHISQYKWRAYDSQSRQAGVTVNGAPHWLAVKPALLAMERPKQDLVIVYFDHVDDVFKEVRPPNWKPRHLFFLTDIEGCLSLYNNGGFSNPIEVWTMKEHGESNSWAKLFSIPCTVPICMHSGSMEPLRVTKKGEVVVFYFFRSVIYIFKDENWRALSPALGVYKKCTIVPYVDSLVLPTRSKKIDKEAISR